MCLRMRFRVPVNCSLALSRDHAVGVLLRREDCVLYVFPVGELSRQWVAWDRVRRPTGTVNDDPTVAVATLDFPALPTTPCGRGIGDGDGQFDFSFSHGGGCFTDRGTLLVADYGNHRLPEVDLSTGLFSRVLADGVISSPTAVDWSPAAIIVAQACHCVSIVSTGSGAVTHRVSGTTLGSLRHPRSVLWLRRPGGDLVAAVSDQGNSRIVLLSDTGCVVDELSGLVPSPGVLAPWLGGTAIVVSNYTCWYAVALARPAGSNGVLSVRSAADDCIVDPTWMELTTDVASPGDGFLAMLSGSPSAGVEYLAVYRCLALRITWIRAVLASSK